MTRLIVNADDFGLTTGVNRAIVELHRTGALTSTTLMARAEATSEAVNLAKSEPELGVGCHVVLVDGESVLAQIATGSGELVLDSAARPEPQLATGKHIIRLTYRDPGVVFEHIALTWPGAPPAYPVPPETRNSVIAAKGSRQNQDRQ